MSRNTDKIKKALAAKGYIASIMRWEPIGANQEMCGPSGGWFIVVESAATYEDGEREHIECIMAYNTNEAIEEIECLPNYNDLLKGAE